MTTLSTSPTPLRASICLATADKTSILSKAVSRKVQQCEGGNGTLTESNLKKIIRKSRRCGVMLEVDEVKKFAEFANK